MTESREQKKSDFDFEDLYVYKKSLDFIDEIFLIIKDIPREYRYSIGENLIRAALSICNNLAEGNDKLSNKEKSKYFRTSIGSARECVSVLIILNRQKLINNEIFLKLKISAKEITSMIYRMLR